MKSTKADDLAVAVAVAVAGAGADRAEQPKEDEEEGEAIEEDEEEGEGEGEGEEEPATALEEGFYEIEDIRKKRVRKGQPQYLIKWRGWPDSANTWEPLANLQGCADVIEVFEERLTKSSRKRKRKPVALGKKKPSPPPPPPTHDQLKRVSETTDAIMGQQKKQHSKVEEERKEGKKLKEDIVATNAVEGYAKMDHKEGGCTNAPPGYVSILLPAVREDSSSTEGLSKLECAAQAVDEETHLTGARRRKAGPVRRVKQDLPLVNQGDVQNGNSCEKGEKCAEEGVDPGQTARQGSDLVGSASLTEIVKVVEFHSSVSDDAQEISLTFEALRSDGQKVRVTDRELKANNPLLLISYYEQHLRYSKP